ncbi:MAG TPA: RDD family protein [Flavisolibacter sp.]
MSGIHVSTHFNIDLEFEAAPFYKRLLAWFLDMVLLIVFIVLFIRFYSSVEDSMGEEVQIVVETIILLIFVCYHLLCEIFMNGQSIGKRITGIRVVNENGGRPTIGQYIIRWLIRTSDIMVAVVLLTIPFAVRAGDLDYLWKIGIAIGLLLMDIILTNTGKQQRLGDILAHTMLITTKSRESITDTIFLDVSDKYVPSFPQVMQLTDKDINSLKGILDTARRRHDFDLAQMAAEKIKAHLRINTSLSPFDFLEILLKDYNYLSTN